MPYGNAPDFFRTSFYFTHSKQASENTVLTDTVLYIFLSLFASESFVSKGGLK